MILGLDIGKHLGWFKASITGPAVWGTVHLPETKNDGLWLAAADDGLRDALRGITGVAYESPYMGSNARTAERLYGLIMHIKYHGHHLGLGPRDFLPVPVSVGKLTLAGHGHASDEQMLAAAHGHGYMLDDDHQAHALGAWWVWQFGRAEPIRKSHTRSGKGISVRES